MKLLTQVIMVLSEEMKLLEILFIKIIINIFLLKFNISDMHESSFLTQCMISFFFSASKIDEIWSIILNTNIIEKN